MGHPLRTQLVEAALAWQKRNGIAPAITAALSEYDAALLLGMTDEDYSQCITGRTAVTQGADFVWRSRRYQTKANRPSGAPRSRVTLVPKANNYDWDFLIWILYDWMYAVQEA
jgi:G:T/U-mismatch repair DNA glycosylase